ncbi:glycosyltransferase family 2 protein [Sphingomicrobium sp. XHP0239]|uniref:glycosyltransferase family 2 protein n=1 Tax=Sphingomicrobium maritimum TaxID=3133972 RepID=UPI0031CC75F1
MVKLIIQIPCYNEEQTLPSVLTGIPERIDGIDVIETLVIDDGSSDRTVEVARKLGVTHIVQQKQNRGLARGFQRGIDEALRCGADIIVNTDGDNQYDGSSIPELVRPILEGCADIVVGDRGAGERQDFSWTKRFLQKFGSWTVRQLASVQVPDAVSGFRAYTRDAAMNINVLTNFSYTTETLIHASQRGYKIASVPVATNPQTRPSRLFKSIPSFVSKQAVTIVRSFVMYRSLRAFVGLGLIMLLIGMIPVVRFLYYYAIGEGDGKVQSLILGGVFLLAGYLTTVLALLSDVVATNRKLIEQVLGRVRKIEMAVDADSE